MRIIIYIFVAALTLFFLYAPFDSEFGVGKKVDRDISFGELDPSELIATCQSKLDESADSITGFIMEKADWITKDKISSFDEIYQHQPELLADGKVVWAAIVQANEDLFKGSNEQLPAAIVYSLNEKTNFTPGQLTEISEKIFDIKGNSSDDQVKEFAAILADETNVHLKIQVPDSLTNGLECYYGCTVIAPKFLPDKKLSKKLIPIITLPLQTDAIIILPTNFWDSRLLEFYK